MKRQANVGILRRQRVMKAASKSAAVAVNLYQYNADSRQPVAPGCFAEYVAYDGMAAAAARSGGIFPSLQRDIKVSSKHQT